jgi:hypothetical protein
MLHFVPNPGSFALVLGHGLETGEKTDKDRQVNGHG